MKNSLNFFRLFAKDYLGLSNNAKIKTLLKKQNENEFDFRCYSDSIYLINEKREKRKRSIFITGLFYRNFIFF